jgi:hypothetical protein
MNKYVYDYIFLYIVCNKNVLIKIGKNAIYNLG